MVCRRWLMVMVKRFGGLFIGYKRGREIKREVGARGISFVYFKNIRNDLILLVRVDMPLPRFHSSQSI